MIPAVSRVLIVVALVCIGKVNGGPFAYVAIGKLEKIADVVLVGSGRPLSSNKTDVLVELAAERVLKGNIISSTRIVAVWAAPSEYNARIPTLSETSRGMWFLKKRENADWEILPIGQGDVHFDHTHIPFSTESTNPDFVYTPDAPSAEKVIKELGAELERSGGDSKGIVAALFSMATPEEFSALPELHTKFTRSSSPRLKALGLQGLIKQGDSTALAKMLSDRDVLDAVSKEPSLSVAICDLRSQDPQFIETLSRLIGAENPSHMRRCAAYSLRAIHTRPTLRFLAQLLDSDSNDLRYEGVIGLASFANNLPVQTKQNVVNMGWLQTTSKGPYSTEETQLHFPAKDVFDKDESKYTKFWSNWWAANKASLTLPQ